MLEEALDAFYAKYHFTIDRNPKCDTKNYAPPGLWFWLHKSKNLKKYHKNISRTVQDKLSKTPTNLDICFLFDKKK